MALITKDSQPVHAYIIQLIILANHMNGKDTHVRGLRVLGPVECVLTVTVALNTSDGPCLTETYLKEMTHFLLHHQNSRCMSVYDEMYYYPRYQ